MAMESPAMDTDVEAMLRLAWLADREGREGTRDALLTLAMSATPSNSKLKLPADFNARCQSVLSRRLPEDWFDNTEITCLRVKNERVARALAKLRLMFPTIRVRRLLMRAEILQGPYSPNPPRVDQILRDSKLLKPFPKHSILFNNPSFLPFPGTRSGSAEVDPNEELLALYWSVLLAMAVLLTLVLQPETSERDQRAA